MLRRAQREYQQAGRARKSQMLDDLVQYTGIKRKTIIGRLNGSCLRAKRSQERRPSYGADVDDCLRVIADAHDYICAERLEDPERTRSREYEKNDARFVEQRKGDLIRGYVGAGRLDTVAQVRVLNRFYERLRVYHNLCQPVLRLQEKVPSEDGQRIIRRYSPASTPWTRLCAAEGAEVKAEDRARLDQLYPDTNPRVLKWEMEKLLAQLWRLPNATPGCPEDVRETLYEPSASSEKGEGEAPVDLPNE